MSIGSNLSFNLFLIFLAVTLAVTYWASRQTKTPADYYAANHRMTGWQNGIAISGDYTSAASFLGVPGLIALAGLDGMIYVVGFLVALLLVMVVVGELFRNVGRYTIADAVARRLRPRPIRLALAASTIAICLVYLIAQMVGAGKLVALLFNLEGDVLGIPAESAAIFGIGMLMVVYVTFGGMLGITWVQIIKAILLLVGSTAMAVLALSRFGFSFTDFFSAAVEGSELGAAYLAPGLRFDDPLDLISLGLGLALGTIGLPHIMIRLYTVSSAAAVRSSMNWAIGVTGWFYIMSTLIGFGAAAIVGSAAIREVDPQGNLAGPLLAQTLGGGAETFGGDLLLAGMAALAVATILGAIAGLTIAAASSFSHDVYAGVISKGRHNPRHEVLVARLAALAIGVAAVGLGTLFQDQNVAFLVGLAFAIAASANMPVLVLSLYWRRLNTTGAVSGILGGLFSCLLLVGLGPTVMGPAGVMFTDMQPLVPLGNPGIISIPMGFVCAVAGTYLSREPVADPEDYDDMRVLALTGVDPKRPLPDAGEQAPQEEPAAGLAPVPTNR